VIATMKRCSRAVLAAMVLIAGRATVSTQTAPVLTLEQAVDEALAKNERILNQQDSASQAELGVELARNEFRPKIVPNIFGSFAQSDVNSQNYRVDMAQKFTTGTELRVGVGTSTSQIPLTPGASGNDIHFYNADTTITLSQPLLRGFGPAVAKRSLAGAELRRADAERDRAITEQQIAIETASTYYRIVAQQAVVEVARKSLERSRKLRDASEAKLGAGLVSQLDVLRAHQLVTQAEMQLFDAQSGTDDAREQLSFLMGREETSPFEVQTAIPVPREPTADPEAAVAVALANRLDLKSVQAHADDADLQVRFARNQLLPQVDVNFALTRRETADSFSGSFGLDRFRFVTFFTIATPFDRTAQAVGYQNAAIDRDRRKREAVTLERRIADDVRRAVREEGRLIRLLAAAETSMDIARQETEVAQLRYERGLSNNLEVVTAEGNLLGAESRRIQVLADLATARLSLRALLGILDPRRDLSAFNTIDPKTGGVQ
jgi:outer membrane protein TolC